jgi:hypothetical protein
MAKTYTFWYDETYTYKAGFTAESLEEAQKLLAEVFEGETAIEDLPGYWSKDKGYESDYAPETLEEYED